MPYYGPFDTAEYDSDTEISIRAYYGPFDTAEYDSDTEISIRALQTIRHCGVRQ